MCNSMPRLTDATLAAPMGHEVFLRPMSDHRPAGLRRVQAILLAPLLALLAVMAVVELLQSQPAQASPAVSAAAASLPALPVHDASADEAQSLVRYVATDGQDVGDCTTPVSRCLTVQYAVDSAADGDLIKVAAGVYTGVHARPSPPGYPGPSVITQVVYISKSLSLQGGFTGTNWSTPYPISYPTTLDAQGQGRVMMVSGSSRAAVDGLRITGGDATGLNESVWGLGHGGGIWVSAATVTVRDTHIFSNTAGPRSKGGGIYVYSGDGLVLEGNLVYSNTLRGDYGLGAGCYVEESDQITITGNTLSGNNALTSGPDDFGSGGGGAVVGPCTGILIEKNRISNNQVYGVHGGLAVWCDDATIKDNVIAANRAGFSGGGLSLYDSNHITVTGNMIVENQAAVGDQGAGVGAGVHVMGGTDVTFINNVVADNRLVTGGEGSGAYILGSQVSLLHNTFARNSGGDGSGIHMVTWEYDPDIPAKVTLTNTILVSHSVGITVGVGSTATLEGTLWGSGAWVNETDWAGAGTILTGTVNIWGDPAFVDPDGDDYHLGPGSAAIDAGVEAGIFKDIDGEPRPARTGYDIGADEVQSLVRYVATDGQDVGDCSTPVSRCLTVQYAVDSAADGDVIKVAAGVYTGVHARPSPPGYPGPSVVTQVVYVSKTLSIQGGYTTTQWSDSDPEVYSTTLDAQGQGRVLFISGTLPMIPGQATTTTVEGLQITGGDVAGLGGGSEDRDAGGGVHVISATAIFSGNHCSDICHQALC